MTDIEIPLGKRTAKYRFFEMLPALLSYGLILLPVVLSLINPLLAAIFITAYLIMFFVKAMGIAYRTVQGYRALALAQKVDWQARLQDLENPEDWLQRHQDEPLRGWRAADHIRTLQKIVAKPHAYPRPSEVFNAVIIPIYKEGADILEPTLKALFASHYDMNRLILIMAYEERGPKEVHELSKHTAKQYAERCFHAAAIMHPKDIPGEVIGKGGNITHAGRYLQQFLKEQHISPNDVIVTTLDCDNRPHPSYLAYTTYEYIINDMRHNVAYQPIALYLNNIWDASAPMRVIATGNSFWTIINSMRPHMLRNFSAHSQGMASLNRTHLWSVRTIVEDGHQYWRSYFAFDGDYEVVPIYVPIYQDAVLAETYTKTIKAQFLQLRRWAYGASDVAYLADKGFRKDRTVPFFGFLARFLRLLDNHVSWASAPIIITFGAWIPLIINAESSRSIVAHELPQIASNLQLLALCGLFIMIYLTFKLLPPRPERYKRRRNIFMIAQWILMPVITICFGVAAAMNAQTRLLISKYLDSFDLTEKVVKK